MLVILSGWRRAALTSLSAKPPPEKINRSLNHKDKNQWHYPPQASFGTPGADSRQAGLSPQEPRVRAHLGRGTGWGLLNLISRSRIKRRGSVWYLAGRT